VTPEGSRVCVASAMQSIKSLISQDLGLEFIAVASTAHVTLIQTMPGEPLVLAEPVFRVPFRVNQIRSLGQASAVPWPGKNAQGAWAVRHHGIARRQRART